MNRSPVKRLILFNVNMAWWCDMAHLQRKWCILGRLIVGSVGWVLFTHKARSEHGGTA